MGLNVIDGQSPKMELVQAAIVTGNPCEPCPAKGAACGTEACPMVSKVRGIVQEVQLSARISQIIESRGWRVIEGSKSSSESQIQGSGSVAGGGEVISFCKSCEKSHGASFVCEPKKKAA